MGSGVDGCERGEERTYHSDELFFPMAPIAMKDLTTPVEWDQM